jgi:hypothetical protein
MQTAIALLSVLLAADAAPKPAPAPAPPPAAATDDDNAKPPPRTPRPDDRRRPLRAEYDKLRDALFQLRARSMLVEEGCMRRSWAQDPLEARPTSSAARRGAADGNSIWDSGEKPLVDEMISVSDAWINRARTA